MNILKSAVQDLREYLHNDTNGVKLLEKIVNIANVQRKRVQALEEAAVEHSKNLKAARMQLEKAESDLSDLRRKLESETAARLSAERRAAGLQAEIAKLSTTDDAEQDEPEAATDSAQLLFFRTTFKEVRRRFRNIATLVGREKSTVDTTEERPFVLMVEDFVPAYSANAFAGLGMFATVLALMNFPISIKVRRSMHDNDAWEESDSQKFVQWLWKIVGDYPSNKLLSKKAYDKLYGAVTGETTTNHLFKK